MWKVGQWQGLIKINLFNNENHTKRTLIFIRNQLKLYGASEKEDEEDIEKVNNSITEEKETLSSSSSEEESEESELEDDEINENHGEKYIENQREKDIENQQEKEIENQSEKYIENSQVKPMEISESSYKHHLLKSYFYSPNNNQIQITLTFPASSPKLLLLDIVEEMTGSLVIHEIKNISKCYWNPEEEANNEESKKPQLLHTDGVNLKGVLDLGNIIGTSSIYTNDIHAVLECFGVEAARALIVREVGAVFDVYGISVDYRHLSLIADQITFDGTYRPFNRQGMQQSYSSSPFLQMSFETTMAFMKNAALFGSSDDLETPSSRIVMGLPTRIGTGMMKIIQKFEE